MPPEGRGKVAARGTSEEEAVGEGALPVPGSSPQTSSSSKGRTRGGSRAPSHMVLGRSSPPPSPDGRGGVGAREAAAPAGVSPPVFGKSN